MKIGEILTETLAYRTFFFLVHGDGMMHVALPPRTPFFFFFLLLILSFFRSSTLSLLLLFPCSITQVISGQWRYSLTAVSLSTRVRNSELPVVCYLVHVSLIAVATG